MNRVIHTSADGLVVTLIDPADPARTQELPGGQPTADFLAACDLFFGPEVIERRSLKKSVVQERVNAIGKLDAVLALLLAPGNAIYYARWFAPDWPEVYADDAGLMTILTAVGCTADQIAAVTAE